MVSNDDVAAANKKNQEMQDYIDDASSNDSSESEMFQRQAAQLNFLSDCTVCLFVGGVEVMKEAANSM